MVAGIGKLRRGRRRYFQAEYGRKYGQDRRCRYFSNDSNATVRTRYPQRAILDRASIATARHQASAGRPAPQADQQLA